MSKVVYYCHKKWDYVYLGTAFVTFIHTIRAFVAVFISWESFGTCYQFFFLLSQVCTRHVVFGIAFGIYFPHFFFSFLYAFLRIRCRCRLSTLIFIITFFSMGKKCRSFAFVISVRHFPDHSLSLSLSLSSNASVMDRMNVEVFLNTENRRNWIFSTTPCKRRRVNRTWAVGWEFPQRK